MFTEPWRRSPGVVHDLPTRETKQDLGLGWRRLMHFLLNSLAGLANGSAYVFSKQFLKFVKCALSQGAVSFGTQFKPYCLYF